MGRTRAPEDPDDGALLRGGGEARAVEGEGQRHQPVPVRRDLLVLVSLLAVVVHGGVRQVERGGTHTCICKEMGPLYVKPTYVTKYLVGDFEAERVVEDYHAVLLRGVGQVAAMG